MIKHLMQIYNNNNNNNETIFDTLNRQPTIKFINAHFAINWLFQMELQCFSIDK